MKGVRMVDDMTIAQRSYTMSRIRSTGNEATEQRFIRLLRTSRIGGWRRKVPLPGRPDLVFPKERVVVFLDGCFWHGCPNCSLRSKSNVAYWRPKILGNAARDHRNTATLRKAGWKVVRIWEHSIRQAPKQSLLRLQRTLSKRMIPRRDLSATGRVKSG